MRKLLVALATALSLAAPALAEGRASIASGEAATREAALASALRHAVEQVVGLSINTGTYVQNLKQIQDQVITQAAGYIESYDVVGEERTPDGGYRVTVNAKVSQEKLGQAMTPIVGNVVTFDGSAAIANLTLDRDQEASVSNALRERIADLGKNGIKFTYDLKTVAYGSDDRFVYLRLDNLEAKVEPGWYDAYKKLHRQLTATELGKKTVEIYTKQNWIERPLVMTLLSADGEVVETVQGESWDGTRSSRWLLSNLATALTNPASLVHLPPGSDVLKPTSLPYLPPSWKLGTPVHFKVRKELLSATSKFTLTIPLR